MHSNDASLMDAPFVQASNFRSRSIEDFFQGYLLKLSQRGLYHALLNLFTIPSNDSIKQHILICVKARFGKSRSQSCHRHSLIATGVNFYQFFRTEIFAILIVLRLNKATTTLFINTNGGFPLQ